MHSLPEDMAIPGTSQLNQLLPSTPIAQVVKRHVCMSPCEVWNHVTDSDETSSYSYAIGDHHF